MKAPRLNSVLLCGLLLVCGASAVRADDAASEQSISQCLAAIKATIQASVFDQVAPVCTLVTPDGIAIENFAIQRRSRPEGLLSSDIGEFFRAFVSLWPGEEGSEEAHFETLPTDGVYRVATSVKDSSGAVTEYSDRSAGSGPQYAVIGDEKIYMVRCNAGSIDDCVWYSNLFARHSPDGGIAAPGGAPWAPQFDPCYVLLRHSFHELGDGAGLPTVVATVESLVRRSSEDLDMRATYETFCSGSR